MLIDALNLVKMQKKQVNQRGGASDNLLNNNSYERTLEVNFEKGGPRPIGIVEDDGYFGRISVDNSPNTYQRDTSRNGGGGHYKKHIGGFEGSKHNVKDNDDCNQMSMVI